MHTPKKPAGGEQGVKSTYSKDFWNENPAKPSRHLVRAHQGESMERKQFNILGRRYVNHSRLSLSSPPSRAPKYLADCSRDGRAAGEPPER